jgi:YVTN family beta-propeller protein
MKKIFFLAAVLSFSASFAQHKYKVTKTFHIASPGGWDYLSINGDRLYVSHGNQVNILNKSTGDSLAVISNTTGVHGIAFDKDLNRGYTSNGRANSVTVFDLKTNEVITQVTTGENPDAIMFEPHTGMIITCNGRGKSLSIIDPKTNTVVQTIDVGGKPETAVSDDQGKIFVNIEDKNEIVCVDLKTHSVHDHWSLNGAEGPTGLAYDSKTKRLFAGCDAKLVVMNAENGKIVAQLPIGDGCDGVAFDSWHQLIFTSNGVGNISVIQEKNADKYKVLDSCTTKRGARTITIDEKTGTLYLPTADFEAPTVAGQRPKMIPGSFQVLVVE